MNNLIKEFAKGIIKENPTFVLALGLCPTLAVSVSVVNGIGMGLASTFVIVCSNVIIAAIKNLIPGKIRIPCYIVIIAAFVTITELALKAYFPPLNRALGIYVPLIVVNCIVLGRAEAFASKNTVAASLFDGLGMGAGFTIALVMISAIRELLGSGKICGLTVIPDFQPALLIGMPAGALLVIGLLLGFFNMIKGRKANGS